MGKKILIALGGIVVVFAYLFYGIYVAFDIGQPVTYFGAETCKYVAGFPGVEDITWYSDKFALGVTDSKFDLFELGNVNATEGAIVLLDPAE
jgi:hypothetical protein